MKLGISVQERRLVSMVKSLKIEDPVWPPGVRTRCDSPWMYIGRKITFSDDRDAMVGTITGISTTDDGRPLVEVSNRFFSGLMVKYLLLERSGKATLFTTAKEKEYAGIPGQFSVLSGLQSSQ